MGQKNTTQNPASRFQPPVEASDKHVGTFQAGQFKEKLTISGVPLGDDRGCSSTNIQSAVSEEQAISETQHKKRDYFTDNVTISDLCTLQEGTLESNNHVGQTPTVASGTMYPRDARIVAPLRGGCTRSMMLIPNQNIMIEAPHEVASQDDGIGPNEATVQGEQMVRYFIKNMEHDVPTELIKTENSNY